MTSAITESGTRRSTTRYRVIRGRGKMLVSVGSVVRLACGHSPEQVAKCDVCGDTMCPCTSYIPLTSGPGLVCGHIVCLKPECVAILSYKCGACQNSAQHCQLCSPAKLLKTDGNVYAVCKNQYERLKSSKVVSGWNSARWSSGDDDELENVPTRVVIVSKSEARLPKIGKVKEVGEKHNDDEDDDEAEAKATLGHLFG